MLRDANLHWRYLDTDWEVIMPWFTLPCLEWILKQDYKDWNVFEYGGGYSGIWWKAKCTRVNGVDSNPFWAKICGYKCESDRDKYVNSIVYNNGAFDVIVVDGVYRVDCIKKAVDWVRNGGFMILDNYDDYSKEEIDTIKNTLKGWFCEVHKQPNHSKWETAVYRKP